MLDLGRYKDKPFLLLLEAYVLDAIRELPPTMEQLAKSIASKFFGSGDWRKRLRQEVGFDKALNAQVVQLWADGQRIAKEKGAVLVPAEFAQALVEDNFSEIIEMATADLEAEEAQDDDA